MVNKNLTQIAIKLFMRTASEILDEIRSLKGLGSDAALGDLFGVKQTTVASWRSRNSIPFEEVIAFCVKEGISLDRFIVGGDQKAIAAEAAPIWLSKIGPAEKKKLKLVNKLVRIVDEGDDKKIKAVEAQLDLLDPGEKKPGVANEADGGAGANSNCA